MKYQFKEDVDALITLRGKLNTLVGILSVCGVRVCVYGAGGSFVLVISTVAGVRIAVTPDPSPPLPPIVYSGQH